MNFGVGGENNLERHIVYLPLEVAGFVPALSFSLVP